jgi:hypothetical protein
VPVFEDVTDELCEGVIEVALDCVVDPDIDDVGELVVVTVLVGDAVAEVVQVPVGVTVADDEDVTVGSAVELDVAETVNEGVADVVGGMV